MNIRNSLDDEAKMSFIVLQMSLGMRDVRCQPFSVVERHEHIVPPMPDLNGNFDRGRSRNPTSCNLKGYHHKHLLFQLCMLLWIGPVRILQVHLKVHLYPPGIEGCPTSGQDRFGSYLSIMSASFWVFNSHSPWSQSIDLKLFNVELAHSCKPIQPLGVIWRKPRNA